MKIIIIIFRALCVENRSAVGNDRDVDAAESVLLDREQKHQAVYEPDRKHIHLVILGNRTDVPQK